MTQHLIGLGDEAPRDTSPTFATHQATPRAELLAQLMDPNVPKTEREHAAADEVERLTAERDMAIDYLARWCVAVDVNGTGWDDWDEHYKDAAYRPSPIRELLDAAIAEAQKEAR
jgi:hypothetical protein